MGLPPKSVVSPDRKASSSGSVPSGSAGRDGAGRYLAWGGAASGSGRVASGEDNVPIVSIVSIDDGQSDRGPVVAAIEAAVCSMVSQASGPRVPISVSPSPEIDPSNTRQCGQDRA